MPPFRFAPFPTVISIFLFSFSNGVVAAGWFDTFNDGSILDGSPATWTFNEFGVTPGSYDASSGDLVLSAPGDPLPIIPTDPTDNNLAPSIDVIFSDTYARTQAVTIPDDPNTEGRGNVGIVLRWNPNTVTGYVALMDHGDQLEIVRIDGGVPQPLFLQEGVGVNTLTDAVMEVEMVGSQLSVYLWEASGSKPSTPLTTVTDSTYPSGRAGLFFNEDSDGHFAIFRYAIAQDTPIIPADFDSNGTVDGVDLLQWESDYGINGDSDGDFDGDSDALDLLVWQRQAGAGANLAAALVIPEPSTLGLCVVIALASLLRSSRLG